MSFIRGDEIPVGSLWHERGFVYECHSNRGGDVWLRLYAKERPGKLTLKQPTAFITSPRGPRVRMTQCRVEDVASLEGQSI